MTTNLTKYETLEHQTFDLGKLPAKQKKFLEEVKTYFEKNPSWCEFGSFWFNQLSSVFKNVKKEDIPDLPVFKICQDMESRLGVKQRYARLTDYRDILAKIISEVYKSRYLFCKEVGIDEAFLSNVLKKKKHFSTKKLQEILDKAGYDLEIKKRHAFGV